MITISMRARAALVAAAAICATSSIASASIINAWKLDESAGALAVDAVNGTSATVAGSSSFTGAKINNGFKTTGNTLGYVNAGNVNLTGSFSLSFWVKPEDVSLDWRNMISKQDGAAGNKSFWVGQSQADGALRFGMFFNGTTETALDTAGAVVASGAYSFVTASWNEQSKTQSIYVNGALAASAVRTGSSFLTSRSSNLLFATNSTSATAGAGTGSWARFSGTLDDIALWNEALPAGQVKALFNITNTAGLSSYDATSFATVRQAYLTNFSQQVGNTRWSRATGLSIGEGAVQHRANGYVMQLDSLGGGVSALSTISLSYDPAHTNLAVGNGSEPAVHFGDLDPLQSDSSIGSADIRPTSPQAGIVLVMLWLRDTQGTDDRAILRSELSGASDGSYSLLDSSDPNWSRLQTQHGGFDTLVEFSSATLAGSFNWDFATHSDVVLDQLAIATVPEPASIALLACATVLLTRRRSRLALS